MTTTVERDRAGFEELEKRDRAHKLLEIIEQEAKKVIQVREGDNIWIVTCNLNEIATSTDRQAAYDRAETERQIMRMRFAAFHQECKLAEV